MGSQRWPQTGLPYIVNQTPKTVLRLPIRSDIKKKHFTQALYKNEVKRKNERFTGADQHMEMRLPPHPQVVDIY